MTMPPNTVVGEHFPQRMYDYHNYQVGKDSHARTTSLSKILESTHLARTLLPLFSDLPPFSSCKTPLERHSSTNRRKTHWGYLYCHLANGMAAFVVFESSSLTITNRTVFYVQLFTWLVGWFNTSCSGFCLKLGWLSSAWPRCLAQPHFNFELRIVVASLHSFSSWALVYWNRPHCL